MPTGIYVRTEEIRKKLSQGQKGRIFSIETCKKISKALTGKKLSKEHRKNLSLAKKGKIPSCTYTRNFSGKNNPAYGKNYFANKKHPNWKGSSVGYSALHDWVDRKLGRPTKCEHCGKNGLTRHQIHWANKGGLYKRNLSDWLRLCASCHKKYDNRKK